MAAWMVALISWSVGHNGGVHAKSAKNDTEKNGFGPQIPGHNLAHFCRAKCCHAKMCLLPMLAATNQIPTSSSKVVRPSALSSPTPNSTAGVQLQQFPGDTRGISPEDTRCRGARDVGMCREGVRTLDADVVR